MSPLARKDRRSFVFNSPMVESHVVPTVSIRKVRASVSVAYYFLSAIVLISCNFMVLANFNRCDFWVVPIFFSGYSCLRRACFDPSCHVLRIIFSLGMVMLPAYRVWRFCGESWLAPTCDSIASNCFSDCIHRLNHCCDVVQKRDIAPSCLSVIE